VETYPDGAIQQKVWYLERRDVVALVGEIGFEDFGSCLG
jgi:hypothetical protein